MSPYRRALFSLSLAAVLPSPATPAAGQVPAERDWGAALRIDAQALHDDIAANHPGPVNRADPGFARRNDAQLALALKRARTARSYADYFYALRLYVASFDDGHLEFGVYGNTPMDISWPGFLTDYDGQGIMRVIVRDERAGVPIGAQLIGCDGRTAAQVAAARLGPAIGRWQLEAQRRAHGRYLFLDDGNRYVPRIRRCTFAAGGKRRSLQLDWQPIAPRDIVGRLSAATARPPRDFASRTGAGGVRWFSMPSFNGEPQSAAGKALPPMIAAMRAGREELVAAPAIVLDLRGNGGGSSDWSRQIAEILWGRAALERLPRDGSYVEWRVSRANLAAIERNYARRSAGGVLSSTTLHWYRGVIAGLTGALARGDALWRQGPDEAAIAEVAPQPVAPALGGPVYVLTDWSCASACLDAVDLWRALGAVHVGQTTSADTLYMEIRTVRSPSGIGEFSMPMKVYRGRSRGSNVPLAPVCKFDGDISETAALERWIAALAARGDGPARGGCRV